jgi:hypothetical protein
MPVTPAILEVEIEGSQSKASQGKASNETLSEKQTERKWAELAQLVQ